MRPIDVASLFVLATLGLGCPRELLGDDEESGDSTDDGDDESETTNAVEPVPSCHPSYDPCLPLVDDLDCPDLVQMGKAPVVVLGDDEYGLDADHDGLGCEP
jgi:hypothetical protein